MSETIRDSRIEKNKSEYSKLQKFLAVGALSLAAIGVGKVYEANIHNNDAREHVATARALQDDYLDNLSGRQGDHIDDLSAALSSVSEDRTPDVARLSRIQGWASESSHASADALGGVHMAQDAASERDDAAGNAALAGGAASVLAGASVAVGRRKKANKASQDVIESHRGW